MEPLPRLRLQIGDSDSRLFTDDELTTLLAEADGNLLLAAAEACDILATRYAGDFDFGTHEDKRFSRSQKSKQYAARAERLRARAERDAERDAGALGTIDVERRDGWDEQYDPGRERCKFPCGEQLT